MSQSVSLTFAAKAAPDAPRRFSGVAYSGGVIPHYGWMGDVAIDLDTLQNQQGDELPILVDHDQRIDAIAGKGRIFRATGPDGLPFLAVEGELSDATDAGKKVSALFAEGFPVQLSVGMHADVRQVSEPVSINGRSGVKVAVLFLSIRARPSGRAMRLLRRHVLQVLGVSIRARPSGRAMLPATTTCSLAAAGFNPRPAVGPGDA